MKLINTTKDPATRSSPGNGNVDISVTDSASKPVRRGPPNRMNDLTYTDWMKFQKSFFRHTSDQELVEQFIYFFTKSVWPSGVSSRSLVVGAKSFDPSSVQMHRSVNTYCDASTAIELAERLSGL